MMLESQALLQEFPLRRFILVGDSGEQDAAVYADLARRHPHRIAKVTAKTARMKRPDSKPIHGT
eukprot:4988134-Amphidinium_carterae.2